MYKSSTSSFLLDPKSTVSFTFTIGYMHPNICLVYYVENHILFLRKSNSNCLTRYDVATIWMIANKIETNGASFVIQHILGIKRKVIFLPYGDLVTKILEHVWYNFEGEEFVQDIIKIEESTLG